MKLADIKKASANIDKFCEQFGAVITYSNNKGPYIGRMTRKSVQLFVVTGDNILECMMNVDKKVTEKRTTLGV